MQMMSSAIALGGVITKSGNTFTQIQFYGTSVPCIQYGNSNYSLSSLEAESIRKSISEMKSPLFEELLRKCQEQKEMQDQVGRYSIVENGKSQTPTIQASENLRDNWEKFTFY